ncbi:glycosyltransferase family 4 protein [Bacillus paranthracis]|uniref:glycosyltransferase family 4 protein n=1 Tax=Bacillus paranthracis TaxID=2026186 RepID=UPI00027A016D|nr:glycosyltransferase family 4 protein [Bacillus paranthracis]EJR44844.1 hypothetical protein IIK_04974 [Bacillus cereus VD102]MCR6466510.1 glycosyltransferase family 4 protein [Bacillus paranthracis]MCR9018819.1 glycosyltransferase family 4 protein [Bacillus paranthracis]MCU5297632.1 glycosyltransferase family 4 protein [Bacillus paranthracis]
MKILWITNIPSPYRVEFFNELGKYCDLTVLFEREGSSERDKSWLGYEFTSFNGLVMKGLHFGIDKAITPGVIKHIKHNKYDHIVVSNPLTPTGVLAIEYLKLNKIDYSIETDGAFPGIGQSLKEAIKKYILKGAKLYFSTAEVHDQYYIKYGADSKDIIRYPFTSIKENEVLDRPLAQEEKSVYRDMLKMKEDKIILSVGRFVHLKGFDVLLKACQILSEDIGIYIVGGQVTKEYYELRNDLGLVNVHFIDFKNKEELRDFYKAADLFVLPTRQDAWGLVVNEAMSFGLPVITTDKCVAGLQLIEDDRNGYIVPVENNIALADRIETILSNTELMESMSIENIRKIKEYTIEEMVKTHIQVFEGIIR